MRGVARWLSSPFAKVRRIMILVAVAALLWLTVQQTLRLRELTVAYRLQASMCAQREKDCRLIVAGIPPDTPWPSQKPYPPPLHPNSGEFREAEKWRRRKEAWMEAARNPWFGVPQELKNSK